MKALNRPTGTTGKLTSDFNKSYGINRTLTHRNLMNVCLREQMLGEDHRPLVVRKGKRLKEEVKRREAPPETPVVDVSTFLKFTIKTIKSILS